MKKTTFASLFSQKNVTLIYLLLVLISNVRGQISTTAIAPKVSTNQNVVYDSTLNFLGKNVNGYIGQDLYLKGKAETLRQYGYDGFLADYRKHHMDNGAVYKCCDSYNSKYNELAGKYFHVLEVFRHPKAEESTYLYGKKYFLKLQEKESKDILYYEYDTEYESSFPFIVVSFFQKQKELLLGQKFLFADKVLETSTDITTGKVITTQTGQVWTVLDLTIEEKYYSLSFIIQNELKEKTTISYASALGQWSEGRTYTLESAARFTKKFGKENFDRILQGKVKIGMTKEMCKLSWGTPKDINETISVGNKSEQWVYSENYLYFDNGILTTIQ